MSSAPATVASQARTLEVATRHGDGWTVGDVEFVMEFMNEPVEQVAQALGRTLYAVLAVRRDVRLGVTRSRRETPRRVKGGQRWVATFDLL